MSRRLAVRQTGALARRSVLDTLRLPQAWVPSIFFPLTLMAIFTGSFADTFSRVPGFPDVPSFLDFAIAGAIVQGILIGGTSAGAAFATDIEGGFFDRLVASPVSRAAILLGPPRRKRRRSASGRRSCSSASRWSSAPASRAASPAS